ncbi:feruloyl esterase [Microtetraspora sp. NBRC 13810]|uniref:extracellular catalytic domain type 1 short-chain-length polyhydroxyalkanoate depolymerase n=1 Tax=Microtetraspora sp. NBRC 13810 TaxID=3030990 RepID=UPI00249FC1F4|nr:PHB depolymerase family esterase [Microtetraspora sp. NBRC 13810]GLW07070.1 feruloyl esterase [Microtetraspora sp. NBRC 13810]
MVTSLPARPSRAVLTLLAVLLTLTGLAGTALTATPARAASLVQVTSFGSNPGNLAMYGYRPDGLPNGRPLVVLLHGCTQNAGGYFANSGWRKFADQWGFALVVPQTSSANNMSSCFNWFEPGDTTRGQGEAASIRSMVSYAVATYGSDASRVYVSGLSAGGAMTAVMLATYPDVFAAGSIGAGLAYRCAASLLQASGCQYGPTSKTPQQWGDLVRNAYTGYSGPYPRVAIWQGQSDYTVTPANGTQLRDQWTNVRRVSQTPTSTQSLTGGTSLKVYGADDVRLYEIAGMGHGLPVDPGNGADQCGAAAAYFLDTICSAYHDARFFGLDGGGGPTTPPTTTPTPTPTPTPPATCVRANNYAHTTAGRAYQSGGSVFANGSNQAMGLWNTFVVHSLKQTGPGYWVLADGEC